MIDPWIKVLLEQFSELSPRDKEFAQTYFEILLQQYAPNRSEKIPSESTEGPIRERLLFIFMQANPGIQNSDHFAKLEKLINGLVLNVQACSHQTESATI